MKAERLSLSRVLVRLGLLAGRRFLRWMLVGALAEGTRVPVTSYPSLRIPISHHGIAIAWLEQSSTRCRSRLAVPDRRHRPAWRATPVKPVMRSCPQHIMDPRTEVYHRPFLNEDLLSSKAGPHAGSFFRHGDPRFEAKAWTEAMARLWPYSTCHMVNRNQGAWNRILIDRCSQEQTHWTAEIA